MFSSSKPLSDSASLISEEIKKDIAENSVILYMKGTPARPQCGFSNTVCQILAKLGVPFVARDVLSSAELRQGIKDFTNWPTVPQLYVVGEFIGGCDIVKEMYQTNELEKMLKEKGISMSPASE